MGLYDVRLQFGGNPQEGCGEYQEEIKYEGGDGDEFGLDNDFVAFGGEGFCVGIVCGLYGGEGCPFGWG